MKGKGWKGMGSGRRWEVRRKNMESEGSETEVGKEASGGCKLWKREETGRKR